MASGVAPSLARPQESWKTGRLAVVVGSREGHGIAHAFEVFARNSGIEYFVTFEYDEAVGFLSDPPE